MTLKYRLHVQQYIDMDNRKPYAFKASTQEAKVDKSLSLMPSWSTE